MFETRSGCGIFYKKFQVKFRQKKGGCAESENRIKWWMNHSNYPKNG